MKHILIYAAALLLGHTAAAQQSAAAVTPGSMPIVEPEYVYCEIIADHLPSYTGDGVVFDFGQPTGTWVYNWLRNADGENLVFESGIHALNYMIFRGWEFVQAFTSGQDAAHTHYLLRLPAAKLTVEQRQQLTAAPRSKPTKQSRKGN